MAGAQSSDAAFDPGMDPLEGARILAARAAAPKRSQERDDWLRWSPQAGLRTDARCTACGGPIAEGGFLDGLPKEGRQCSPLLSSAGERLAAG